MLQYLDVSNTKEGITVTSSNAMLHNVSSSFSLANGMVINLDNKRSPTVETMFYELEASNNGKSGIFLDSVGLPSNEITFFRVNKCVVYRNKERGLVVRANASVSLTECLIQENERTGVYVYQRNGGKIKLKSSTILQNFNYAIYEYYTEELVLESCSFANHHHRFYTNFYLRSRPYIVLRREYRSKFEIKIINNTFNNIADGIEVILKWNSRGNFSIHLENNTFTGGNKTLRISNNHYSYYDNMAYITVKNNIFINNTNMYGQLFEYKINNVGSVSFENNIFEGNMAKQIILISGHTRRRSFGDILIHSNQFLFDWASDSIVDVQNYHTITLTNNIFKNADVGACCLKAPIFDNVFSINATYNYWGTNSAMEVVDRVCGFEKDMTKSFIYYIPFYIEEDLKEFNKISQDSVNVSGALGGLVTNDFTITDVMVAASLLISRSLFLR
jgi:hypothetical protein